MSKLQIKILAIFLVIPLSLLIGCLFDFFLLFIASPDEYGYPKSKYFGWVYSIFYLRDGLYNVPNFLFYFITLITSYVVSVKIIRFIIMKLNFS